MWVGTLQHKGAVRPCWSGMLWGAGQRSSFLEKNVTAAHTRAPPLGKQQHCTLTFSKSNKLGWENQV